MRIFYKLLFCCCALFLFLRTGLSQKTSSAISISVKFTQDITNDTVILDVWTHFFAQPDNEPHNRYYAKRNNDVLKFPSVTADDLRIICVSFKDQNKNNRTTQVLSYFVAEPGDDLLIEIGDPNTSGVTNSVANQSSFSLLSDRSLVFTGKGVLKYELQYELRRQRHRLNDSLLLEGKKVVGSKFWKDSTDYVKGYASIPRVTQFTMRGLRHTDSIGVSVLTKNRNKLSKNVFNVLYLDILGENAVNVHRSYLYSYASIDKYISPKSKDSLRTLMRTVYRVEKAKIMYPIEKKSIVLSLPYINFLITDALIESHYRYNDALLFLANEYSGELKDQLITSFFTKYFTKVSKGSEELNKFQSLVKTEYCRLQLDNLADRQSVGKQAYNFSLLDQDNNKISLSDFKGKVVFLDFWFTGCGGCVEYFSNNVRYAEEYFKHDSDIVFITINTDDQKESWIKSLNSGIYTSSRAINLNTGTESSKAQVLINYAVTFAPRPIIIGKTGTIFSNSNYELRDRENGAVLIETIKKALTEK